MSVTTQLFMKGDIWEVFKGYTDAIKDDPDNTNAYVGLAGATIKQGSVNEVIETAQKALSLDP